MPALSLPSYLHITMLYSCYCLPDSHVVQVLRNTTDGVLFWCCSSSPRGVRLCMGRPARARLCSVFSVLFVLCSPRALPVCALLSPGPSRLCSLCCPVRVRLAFFLRLVFVFVQWGPLCCGGVTLKTHLKKCSTPSLFDPSMGVMHFSK